MGEAVVSIKNLTKSYRTQPDAPPLYALKEIHLLVKKGDVFGIIGMSGAGKTTLMRCLTALERPTEGGVFISGEEITALSGPPLRRARKKIGMIFQHFNLFSSRTVLDNIAYPLELEGVSREQRIERSRELLALVGLAAKESAYPAQLSGGEKQRVAIARALVNNPDVLLCDEATSALDPRTTHAILELLSKLNERLGLTIILITHEMEVIKQICTHVAVLEHGEVVEQGPVEELFARPKHPTTQRFLQNMIHEFPEHLKKENALLLRLSFTKGTAQQPIISRMLRQHAVEVNILLGGIDVLKTETIGNLIVELSGDPDERSRARSFLEAQGVVCDELD